MRRAIVGLAMVACAAAACSGAPGEPDRPGQSANAPEGIPSIIGDIEQMDQGRGGTRILVEQIPTRSAGEPIAWITLTESTRVLARADGRTTTASAGELAVGTRVYVWFTGPVAESFPVQATAGTVLIER